MKSWKLSGRIKKKAGIEQQNKKNNTLSTSNLEKNKHFFITFHLQFIISLNKINVIVRSSIIITVVD